MPTQDPLNAEEIAEVQRLFGSPFFIPSAFKSWMADQLALNIPDLPLGSLFGGRGITRSLDATTAASSVSASTFNGQPIYQKTIQGGTMGANGHLRLMIEGYYTQSSGTQLYSVDLFFGGTLIDSLPESSGGNRNHVLVIEIYNANNPRIQYGSMLRLRLTDGAGTLNTVVGSGNGEAAVDTTLDQILRVDIRFTDGLNGNDHWDRRYANLEIVNPAPLGATL